MIDTIQKLSLISGVSGDEALVREEIISQIKGHCDFHVDNLGNIIAFKKGEKAPKNVIQLDAHMDEVGFIITYIEDSGLLRFASCGGIDGKLIVGKAVLIGRNNVCGVIGTKAIHQQSDEEKNKVPELKNLFIDIGAQTKEQAEKLVNLGDRAKFKAEFLEFGEDFILAPALDDRAGCALLIELLKAPSPVDFFCTFTVQEETGLTGAKVASYTVNPDISIAIETTTAGDIAGVSEDKKVCFLGKGPVISFMDKSTIYDSELYHLALATAKEHGIKAQTKMGIYGGNNSGAMHTARNGVRAMAVSMPCRYLHSPSCMLKKSDIEDTLALLKQLIVKVSSL